MLSKIKAYFFIIEFVITVLITIVLMYMFRSKSHAIRRVWANMQTYIMNFKIIEKGQRCEDAQLVLINHQSLVDIIALEARFTKDLCWVAKKEIEDIPLFGHILKAPRMISIDRKDKRSLVKIMKISQERLEQGRVIAMFPEGTRGAGDKLLKFQGGAKYLAQKLNLKVQPIVLVNTRYIFDSQKLIAHSGSMSVIYLDAIKPSENENWYEDMKANMAERLKDELANYTSHR